MTSSFVWRRPWGLGALLLCATLLCQLAAAERTQPGPAVCDAECTKHGNCGEDGHCRCPFGRLGKNCEIDFLAPCRQFAGGDALCGRASAKSCECLKRCQEYFCLKLSNGQTRCHGLPGPAGHQCYRREGVPPDEQYSLIPEPDELAAGKVKCYRGFQDGAEEMDCKEAMVRGVDVSLPMSMCKESCNKRGYCARYADNPEGEPFCRCHRGFEGGLCEIDTKMCYLGCNGKGKCRDQFCKCEPPYFSIGCSRSTVYPANHSRPSPVDFKIYMYELNTQLAFENVYFSGWQQQDKIYIAYQQFLEQFLLSPVRTEDPSEANMFYIPAFTYSYSSNVGDPEPHTELVIDYIRHTYPWWNRTGGRDHFFWVPGDRGACHLTSNPLFMDAVKVVHFGMHTVPGHTGPFPHLGHPSYGCFHPLRDVVNVPYWPPDEEAYPHTKELSIDQVLEKKKTLFFFAGGQTDDPEYSGGSRQALSKLVEEWKDPEFDYVRGGVGEEYEHRLRGSKFCFSPYGHGFGMRLLQPMLCGCVPVIIQEHVFHPYETVLPYEEFSIRLTNAELPRLREILRGVTDEQYRRLLEGVLRYNSAFSWNTKVGGRAFDYTIAALRRSYMNMKAMYFPVYSELGASTQ